MIGDFSFSEISSSRSSTAPSGLELFMNPKSDLMLESSEVCVGLEAHFYNAMPAQLLLGVILSEGLDVRDINWG